MRNENYDYYAKTVILDEISKTFKLIHAKHILQSKFLVDTEVAVQLCNVMEAVFLHGLKSWYAEKNFWSFVQQFSAKRVLQSIKQLSYVTTDVGRCRAWVRTALNDGLLESYLSAIASEQSHLVYHYHKVSFLRDAEFFDIFKTYSQSLHLLVFDIPLNSSLLNVWSVAPMILAGKLQQRSTGTEKDEPSGRSVEVAAEASEKLPDAEVDSDQQFPLDGSLNAASSLDDSTAAPLVTNVPLHRNSLSDVPVFSLGHPTPPRVAADCLANANPDADAVVTDTDRSASSASLVINQSSNRLTADSFVGSWSTSGWTAAPDSQASPVLLPQSDFVVTPNRSASIVRAIDDCLGRPDADDPAAPDAEQPGFASYLQSHAYSESVRKVVDNLRRNRPSLLNAVPEVLVSQLKETGSEHDFEISASKSLDLMKELYQRIANEKGLNMQGYQCADCQRLIGMMYDPYMVCYYDGSYHCCNCQTNDVSEIPARLMHNWDFRKYPLCKFCKEFIQGTGNEPMLNVTGAICDVVPELGRARRLRQQLVFLHAYLAECSQSTILELRRQLWPREYLYADTFRYSFNDLIALKSGQLCTQLNKVVTNAQHHVYSCRLCSQKGFICEICDVAKCIYPFELDTTVQCQKCRAVFHRHCKTDFVACPKCERRRRIQSVRSPAVDTQSPWQA